MYKEQCNCSSTGLTEASHTPLLLSLPSDLDGWALARPCDVYYRLWQDVFAPLSTFAPLSSKRNSMQALHCKVQGHCIMFLKPWCCRKSLWTIDPQLNEANWDTTLLNTNACRLGDFKKATHLLSLNLNFKSSSTCQKECGYLPASSNGHLSLQETCWLVVFFHNNIFFCLWPKLDPVKDYTICTLFHPM